MQVVASFYPLAWMAEQVGGDLVAVASLTPPGVEPHDLELKPRDVGTIADAQVLVYLDGLQPSVDGSVGQASGTVFDVAPAADLLDGGHPADEANDEGDGHDHEAAGDPHFWLDPTRLAMVADAFADVLADRDPEHAATYRTNAAALRDRLADLDQEYRTGLADCASTDLVTSHEAFAYLADRYQFRQIGVTGLTTNREPSARDLADTVEFVRDNDVRTIYLEPLLSPAVAEAVAKEADVQTAVLDPIEGLTDTSAGSDYLGVMRANLATLQQGQRCSR